MKEEEVMGTHERTILVKRTYLALAMFDFGAIKTWHDQNYLRWNQPQVNNKPALQEVRASVSQNRVRSLPYRSCCDGKTKGRWKSRKFKICELYKRDSAIFRALSHFSIIKRPIEDAMVSNFDPKRMEKEFFSNIVMLGFDAEAERRRFGIVFSPDMFRRPNAKGMEVIFHFLICKHSPPTEEVTFPDTKSHRCIDFDQKFSTCWPVHTREQGTEFRKVSDQLYDHKLIRIDRDLRSSSSTCRRYKVHQEIPHRNLRNYLPLLFDLLIFRTHRATGTTSISHMILWSDPDSFMYILYTFSMLVMRTVMERDLQDKDDRSVICPSFPTVSFQNVSLAQFMVDSLKVIFSINFLSFLYKKVWKFLRKFRRIWIEKRELLWIGERGWQLPKTCGKKHWYHMTVRFRPSSRE